MQLLCLTCRLFWTVIMLAFSCEIYCAWLPILDLMQICENDSPLRSLCCLHSIKCKKHIWLAYICCFLTQPFTHCVCVWVDLHMCICVLSGRGGTAGVLAFPLNTIFKPFYISLWNIRLPTPQLCSLQHLWRAQAHFMLQSCIPCLLLLLTTAGFLKRFTKNVHSFEIFFPLVSPNRHKTS